MKPLGYEHMTNFGYEDLGDIQDYGSPSHKSRIPGKNGDIKNSFRKPKKKAEARRIWKRKSRIESKKLSKQTEH